MHSRVPAPRAVAAPGVLGFVPPMGQSERLPPPIAGVVVVVRSLAPLRSGLAFMRSRTCSRAKIILVSNCSNFSKSALSAAIRCSPRSLKFVPSDDSDSGDEI